MLGQATREKVHERERVQERERVPRERRSPKRGKESQKTEGVPRDTTVEGQRHE